MERKLQVQSLYSTCLRTTVPGKTTFLTEGFCDEIKSPSPPMYPSQLYHKLVGTAKAHSPKNPPPINYTGELRTLLD